MEEDNQIIHVYLMPGMAASPDIFEHFRLPEEKFELHPLRWKLPEKNESLEHYAKRMCAEIKEGNCVLIGVSLGGIIVQEMCRFLSVKRLIIISSVKSCSELPPRMHFARKTGVYRFLPTSLVNHVKQLERLPLGNFVKKRLRLYQQYMEMNDKNYLDWAVKKLIYWDQKSPVNEIIHIHGDRDIVFPIKYIHNCIVVPQGTHIMILTKYRWFNKHLPTIICDGKLVP